MVVVGACLIGLEAAASAAEVGVEVTVIEVASRIMARACDAETGAFILAEHQRHGVKFEFPASVTEVTAWPNGRIALKTSGGNLHVADLVLVGAGVEPDDALALAAGLVIQDGIVVDSQCRTSDPHIFAAGDVTRLLQTAWHRGQKTGATENWRHARPYGAVATQQSGSKCRYSTVPSHWSDSMIYVQSRLA
jgi:NADPH-dependent 2,4-dienoyl-CoA reductase/sulfur reductase-like enzyme